MAIILIWLALHWSRTLAQQWFLSLALSWLKALALHWFQALGQIVALSNGPTLVSGIGPTLVLGIGPKLLAQWLHVRSARWLYTDPTSHYNWVPQWILVCLVLNLDIGSANFLNISTLSALNNLNTNHLPVVGKL